MSDQGDRPWRLPRGRHGLPRELVQQSQRERLLSAMVRVTAAKGYEATSVADVLEASGVGRETFYELFEDKQDCFLAAHRLLFEDFLDHAIEAYERPGPWSQRVRVGLAALLDWLAADPGAAKVLVVEVGTVGPASRELFAQTFSRVTALLDEGREVSESARTLSNVSSIAGGAVFARIYEEIVLGRTAQLPQLLPQLTYELLLPFLGEEAAQEEQRRASKPA
jgi:AcrR family transcriptional regulator